MCVQMLRKGPWDGSAASCCIDNEDRSDLRTHGTGWTFHLPCNPSSEEEETEGALRLAGF